MTYACLVGAIRYAIDFFDIWYLCTHLKIAFICVFQNWWYFYI